ncbi:MAG: hypothetical protein COA39_011945 [Sulfurimonas sp.]|nr:hypothetical protein [Sulfurimonas sp.]
MTLIELLQSTANQNNVVIEETFNSFLYTSDLFGVDIASLYTSEYMKSVFTTYNNRDELLISIDYEDDSKVIFRDISEVDNNLSELFEDEYTYTFRIEVNKNIDSNNISIYSSDNFIQWLKTFEDLTDCFSKYNNILSVKGQIYLELLDNKEINLSTKKITFFKQDKCSIIPDRINLLEQRKDYCFVSGNNVPNIVPEDFFVLNESDDEELNTLFGKLCLLSTLTFLSDISEFKENSINYKLYGYKTIKDTFTLNDMTTNSLIALFKIYSWIYHDDNHSSISDKLGITRNLLTLHLKDNTLKHIEGDVYTAIKSNFDIYLKENVQRYLEVKNQVSSFIHDMSIKAEAHSESFVDTMKSSILIFISYFLSIIIVTAIDKGKFINIFTFEVTSITMIILIITWFYRKNTISDIKSKTVRFEEKYNNFKERYSDIIEPKNFKVLFSNDKDHQSDVKYIKDTIEKYDPLWKWTILSFGFITLFFCSYHDTSACFDKLIQFGYFVDGLLMWINP